MWIPNGGSYIWKPYIITAFPDLASSKPVVYFEKVYSELLKSTDSIGNTLAILGVKYVIYHGDSLDYPNEEILQNLMRQKDLKIVYFLNYTYVPEDNSNLPLPINQTDSRSLFQLIEPKELPRGKEINLTLYFKIPQNIVEQGFKGKFWAGFNIILNAFPAGTMDIAQRLFINDNYILYLTNQTLIDEIQGYAVYRVKVPNNYLGTAVDIYANFYNESSQSLTQSYFIGRLSVTPREITVPFIVFENEDYSGEVYGDSRVVYKTEVKQITPVEWNVNVNTSKPFVLIFTEPYDKLWRAYVNGKEVKPFPFMDLVNGFQINETGALNIRLYYTLQDYYNLGCTISITTFFVCAAYFIYTNKKQKN
jgi:hypothetical protein